MKIFSLLLLLLPCSSWAFPEFSRHGYVNCTSCHVSPSGGGLLNLYGREISKENLSTWAKEGEQNFAYGALALPEQLLVSAYLRGLQLHRENQGSREGRPILMQADLEAGIVLENIAVVATAGRQEYRSGANSEGIFVSRRHYIHYRAGDIHNFRIGRFQNFYGLNDANHNLYVRRDLGFGQDRETYNAEYALLGENISFYLTGIAGNSDNSKAYNKEKGASSTLSLFFWDRQKIGISAFQGDDTSADRFVGGVWGIFSWTEKLFSLSEIDFQNRDMKASGAASKSGYVTSHRLSYELVKGFLPFLTLERSHLDRNSDQSLRSGIGLGAQFFPRPHFEISGQWQKERLDKVANSQTDVAWLMLNFYL